MISARGLHIVWTCTSRYWRYVSLPESRFGEVAELLLVCWLEIRGKIDMRMLSPSTMYKAYLVFKLTSEAYEFKNSPVVVTLGLVTVVVTVNPRGLQESELSIQRKELTAGWRWSWVSFSVKWNMGSQRWIVWRLTVVGVRGVLLLSLKRLRSAPTDVVL